MPDTLHASSTSTADADALNSLLRGEISAVETYEQALGKFSEPEHRNISNVLTRIRDEHANTVSVLKGHVNAHGGTPSEGAGVWGVFANAVAGAAKLMGPQTALAALKQGELYGKEQYEKALEKSDLSTECRYLIRSDLHPRCDSHISTLEQLIAQLEQK